MAGKQLTKQVALFSIKPRFAFLIMEGKKKIELRKNCINPNVSFIVVYATTPVQKILGYFSVGKIIKDKKSIIWQKYSKSACVKSEEFDTYYDGKDFGVAIEINEVINLQNPIMLNEVDTNLLPPQSFTYLESSAFATIKGLRTKPALH